MNATEVMPAPLAHVDVSRQRSAATRQRGPRPQRATAIAVLVIASTVTWRTSVLYEGGIDPVVAGKAVLSVLAVLLAASERKRSRGQATPFRTRTIWLLGSYCAVSLFGAWSLDEIGPSAVLVFRLALVAAVIVLMVQTFAPAVLLRAWVVAMLGTAALAAITGATSYVGSGRLSGGVPPLYPNELALLCGLPAVVFAWMLLSGLGSARHGVGLAVLAGLVWATGSRTGLVAMLAACFVMVVLSRRLSPVVACVLVLGSSAVVYLTMATSVVSGFVAREGEELSTFTSRTIAWSAALDYADSAWVRWLGAGLARKEVPVLGQYWDTQLLDSSWISALVQAGVIGTVMLVAWAWITLAGCVRATPPFRLLALGAIVLLLVRSVLESGLVDSTPAFAAFALLSLVVDRRRRGRRPGERPPGSRTAMGFGGAAPGA